MFDLHGFPGRIQGKDRKPMCQQKEQLSTSVYCQLVSIIFQSYHS